MIAGFPVASAAVASEVLFEAQVCGDLSGGDLSPFWTCGASDADAFVLGSPGSPFTTATASAAEGIVSGEDASDADVNGGDRRC